ncbi:hypothetical protein BDV96DRAFT_642208 [Lophiotrema nucula]|uniref:Rhodopsin domain-containing protein n=1 Tax=Lophiotrema nucula TaxID=690887 RepID=A0A6A5ZL67_9PLEO|nr:hypothetical protein BDV96DRAFT_642208 [Lophiotrema nucula]
MTSSSVPVRPSGVPEAIWDLPVLPPPPGHVSNFDHPVTRNNELIIISAVFLTLMVLAVAMRFSVRRAGTELIGWESCELVYQVRWYLLKGQSDVYHRRTCIDLYECTYDSEYDGPSEERRIRSQLSLGLHNGFGRHMWDNGKKPMNQTSAAYTIAVCFAKLFVFQVYLRLFYIVQRTKLLIWFGIVFNVLSSLAFLGVTIGLAVECLDGDGAAIQFCTNVSKSVTSQAAINVLLDFYILFIPLHEVFRLRLPRERKVGVAAVFAVGFLACAASVVRLGWTINNLRETDTTWAAVLTSELSIVEVNMVIIAPCLLFMPAFIKSSRAELSTLRSRLLSSSASSKESEKNLPLRNKFAGDIQQPYRQIRKRQSIELEFLTEAVEVTRSSTTIPPRAYFPTN